MSEKEEVKAEKLVQDLDEIQRFIAESMCVDGTVTLETMSTIWTNSNGYVFGAVFKVVDKTRGTFFISWHQ